MPSVAEAVKDIPQFFNLETPQIRDGYSVPSVQGPPTWPAIRYQVTQPGAFILHYHIQTHFSGGMAVALLDGIDVFPKAPEEYQNGDGVF